MLKFLPQISRRDAVMMGLLLLGCALLCFVRILPEPEAEPGSKEKAVVLSIDNSGVQNFGMVKRGTQLLRVKVLSGKYRDQEFNAANELRSQMDLDKVFAPQDTVLVGILDGSSPEVSLITAQDFYRVTPAVWLFGIFALLLLIFGGVTGFNALLSFIFSCLVIWQLVIPLALRGSSAIAVSLAAVSLLTFVIIFLVAGLNRKGVTAFCGAMLGVGSCALTGWLFTVWFHINGAVMPYSQALLNSGYESLNLSEIYIGAIFLSSSGAVMDLAMDIASGMDELIIKRPELPERELFQSGIRMGRNVVGTMTTTLLLAYSGGYITLLMMFAGQGTGFVDIITNPHVATELVKTLVGSFSLVLVAPFTALVGALILKPVRN